MPKFAANLSLLFTELPFAERFAAAAATGFTAVECQFPYVMPAEGVAAQFRQLNLDLVLFDAPPGDWSKASRGLRCLAAADGCIPPICFHGAGLCRSHRHQTPACHGRRHRAD